MTFYEHYSLINTHDPLEWPYLWFTPQELASKGDGSLLVVHDAILKLDDLRGAIGKPIIVSSAYRDPIHNAKVGGAPMSMHKFGRAFDIKLHNHDRAFLARKAEDVGFTGFGFYNSFLHVDTGRKRWWGKKWEY